MDKIFDKIDDFICHRLNHTDLGEEYKAHEISLEIIEFMKQLLIDSEDDNIIVSKKEYSWLRKTSEKHFNLIEKIEEHQGNEYDEETESFIDNPDCSTCSIGELVLTELDMWR